MVRRRHAPIISPRKKCFHGLLWLSVFSFHSMTFAASSEESWKRIQQTLNRNAGLVAQRINTHYTLPGDDGPMSGHYLTLARLVSKDKVIRELDNETTQSLVGKKFAALDLSIATSLADRPEQLFSTARDFAMVGVEEHSDRSWEILQLRATTRSGSAPITGKIWFDQATGAVWKVQARIDKVPLPGVKIVDVTITYKLDTSGRSLPETVSVAYPISMFFYSGNVAFAQELSDWRSR